MTTNCKFCEVDSPILIFLILDIAKPDVVEDELTLPAVALEELEKAEEMIERRALMDEGKYSDV